MLAFPNFYKRKHVNASYFLDDLEMALLASGQDEAKVNLRVFPLVLSDETKNWFQGLPGVKKGGWNTLKETFLAKYVIDNNPQRLWQELIYLLQDTLGSYSAYEAQFLKLWAEWEASLPEREKAPSFV